MLARLPVALRGGKGRIIAAFISVLVVSLISYTVYAATAIPSLDSNKTQPQQAGAKLTEIVSSTPSEEAKKPEIQKVDAKNVDSSGDLASSASTVQPTSDKPDGINATPSPTVTDSSPAQSSTPSPSMTYPPYVYIGPGKGPVGAVRPGEPLPENLTPSVVVDSN